MIAPIKACAAMLLTGTLATACTTDTVGKFETMLLVVQESGRVLIMASEIAAETCVATAARLNAQEPFGKKGYTCVSVPEGTAPVLPSNTEVPLIDVVTPK